MPWEIHVGLAEDDEERENMPWLALLVFSRDKLQIASEYLNGLNSILKDTKLEKDAEDAKRPIQQSAALALNMTLADVDIINEKADRLVTSPIPTDDKKDTKLDVVFAQSALFNKLITAYENGVPKRGQTMADLSRYKYMAHIRNIQKTGMAASATYEKGLFSVILSHRLGPLSEIKEQPSIVHLVSIENWKNLQLVVSDSVKYVALTSLYSWTYTSMPIRTLNLKRAFEDIGNGLTILRAPDNKIEEIKENENKIAMKVANRLRDGYTLTKYRTQAGEETAAFFRGAFLPSVPNHAFTKGWTAISNYGIDLHIFDQATGLMDITYSAAWNLGKGVALADRSFTICLARLRKYISSRTVNAGKKIQLRKQNAPSLAMANTTVKKCGTDTR